MSAGTSAAKNPNWTRVTTVVTPVDSPTGGTSAKVSRCFVGDPFDQYLDSLGLVKKAMPNNGGSSIYRAVCESLSMDQNEHTSLQEFIESELLFQYRLQRIRTGLPTVNKIEDTLTTIARLLRIELHVYRTIGKQPFVYGGNPDAGESVEKVMVCESHCGHYDLILTRKDHACLGYAQTFVYDLLYFHVFGFSRDVIKNCIKRVRDDMSKEATCGDRALSLNTDGIGMRFGWRPPMPYCAVKSLDPSVYRNVSYDIFLKERKRIIEASSRGSLYTRNRCVSMDSASVATVSPIYSPVVNLHQLVYMANVLRQEYEAGHSRRRNLAMGNYLSVFQN